MAFSAIKSTVVKIFSPVEKKSADGFLGFETFDGFLASHSSSSVSVSVTAETAMRVPAVAAAVNLIASSIGTVPAQIMREIDGSKVAATEHQAHRLVAKMANGRTSAGKLRERMAFDALLYGNGFAYAVRVGDRPVEIVRLDPRQVTIQIDQATGEPTYRLANRVLDQANLIHIPASVSFDGVTGVSPIRLAREAISLAILMEARASKLFDISARPGGVITVPAPAQGSTAELTLKRIIAGWRAAHDGVGKSGATAVLADGATYQPHVFNSVDSQFLEMRVQQTAEIARAFDVPATMIGELSRGAFKNLEEQNRQFLTYCLGPWLTTFKDEFERVLLTEDERDEHSIEFNTSSIVSIDAAAQADKISKLRAAGVFTSNDGRRELNLPALPDGDRLESPHVSTGGATSSPTDETTEVSQSNPEEVKP